MKIKDNLVFQQIADEFIVVPVAEEADRLNGVIKLNATGAFLWQLLAQKEQTTNELVNAMTEAFHISAETAKKDVESFVKYIGDMGCFE